MNSRDLLLDGYGRIPDLVRAAVDGLDDARLADRLDGATNSVAWLVWHLVRVQDDHVADVAGHEQVWTADGWARRFALPLEDTDTGYGHDSGQVSLVRAPADLLLGYLDAVHARTTAYLRGLGDEDLDRVVDERYDPPVTLGVRLVSVLDDDLEHAGQAALLRGVLLRRS
ncbi:mycothiol transferase [Kineococcus glutinatus]|uniref:DUF664 domain-containing protein n=1 Tax=Kineococcus glutinatus TaxID=1070872 RepID=A0ABP9I570_9ACTN